MLAIFTLGLLGASGLGWPVLAGGSFVTGSVAAAWYAAPAALLVAAVSPPMLFGIAVVAVTAATTGGSRILPIVTQTVLTLSGAAPWLVAGILLNLLITWRRGLRQCLAALRRDG
jgi:hypothetical protein